MPVFKIKAYRILTIIIIFLAGLNQTQADSRGYGSITYLNASNDTVDGWDVMAGMNVESDFSNRISGFIGMGLSIPMVWNAAVADHTETGQLKERDEPIVKPSERVGEEYQGIPFQARTGLMVEPFNTRSFIPFATVGVSAFVTRLWRCEKTASKNSCDSSSKWRGLGFLGAGVRIKGFSDNSVLQTELGFYKGPDGFTAVTFQVGAGY